MTKSRCMHKKVAYPYYIVLYRIIPYNVVGHLAIAMGKGFAWATWQNSENQKNVFAWATWQLQWAKGGGGGWHVHTRNAETKHTHMLSQGVAVATSHTANIHNLSIPSYVIQVLQTWAVSQMHSHNSKPQALLYLYMSLLVYFYLLHLSRSISIDPSTQTCIHDFTNASIHGG